MASESDVSVSDLIQRLMTMPLFAAFATARPESDPDHDSETPHHESTNRQSLDRIVLINPLTQGMLVIGGSATGFDSFLNDLARKEGQPPASQAAIDDLPSLEVKGGDEIESLGSECVICLEEWRVGDVVKEMPCKHKFHGACVEKWLKVHGSCPLCRHKMPAADDLDSKVGDDSGRRIRREIWMTFEFSNERPSSEEEEGLNQESPVESQ